jgi:ATP-dependent protease ClpP protease subunit
MEEIAQDIRRPKYFSPSEAVDYGIIDKVRALLNSTVRKNEPV